MLTAAPGAGLTPAVASAPQAMRSRPARPALAAVAHRAGGDAGGAGPRPPMSAVGLPPLGRDADRGGGMMAGTRPERRGEKRNKWPDRHEGSLRPGPLRQPPEGPGVA